MASSTKIERILAPAGGLNTNDSPSVLKDAAPILRNLIPGQNGKIVLRAPIQGAYTMRTAMFPQFGTANIPSDSLARPLGSKIVVSATAVIGPADRTTLIDPVAGTGTAYQSVAFKLSKGSAILNDKLYAYNTAVSPSILNSFDTSGVAVALNTNTPRNGRFVFSYLNALWVFGGRDTPAGLTTDELSTLFYSNPGTAITDVASVWQTTVGGITTTNKIVIGDNTGENDYAVAAIPFNRTLLLLKNQSIYQLVGDSPDNFAVRTVSRNIGCIDARSVCATDRGVYFLSTTGVQRWDGSNLTRIIPQARVEMQDMFHISSMGDSKVLLSDEDASYLYDEITGTLTEITFQINPEDFIPENEAANSLIGYALVRMFSRPLDGQAKWYALIRRETGGVANTIVELYGSGGLDGRGDAGGLLTDRGFKDPALAAGTYGSSDCKIVPYWRSRIVRSSSPMSANRLVKLFVDYVCQTDTLQDDGATADVPSTDTNAPDFLYVKVTREDGTVVLAETVLPSQGITTSLQRKRAVIDLTNQEASEYYIEIYGKSGTNLKESDDYSGSNMVYAKPDTFAIHDVWVEYEPAQRRSAV